MDFEDGVENFVKKLDVVVHEFCFFFFFLEEMYDFFFFFLFILERFDTRFILVKTY